MFYIVNPCPGGFHQNLLCAGAQGLEQDVNERVTQIRPSWAAGELLRVDKLFGVLEAASGGV